VTTGFLLQVPVWSHWMHGPLPGHNPYRISPSHPSQAYPPALPKASEKALGKPRGLTGGCRMARRRRHHPPRRCRGVKAAAKTHAPMVQAVGRAVGHSGGAAAGAVPGAGRRGDGSGRSRSGGAATDSEAVSRSATVERLML
jgi:hypothetical protein